MQRLCTGGDKPPSYQEAFTQATRLSQSLVALSRLLRDVVVRLDSLPIL